MDVPNRMLVMELLIGLALAANGVLGLRKGGLFVGHRLAFKIDQPQLWRYGVASTFATSALLAVHIAVVLVARVMS